MPERNLILVAFLTWFVVGVPHVMWTLRDGESLLWLIPFVMFIVAFAIATRKGCQGLLEWSLIGLQSVLVLICLALQPDGMMPILFVIIAGELGHLSPRIAIVWIIAQTLGVFAISRGHDDNYIIQTFAYFTFQLFGFFAARMAQEEKEARTALAEANAELRVTSGLLDLSSRTEERLRIARDLHDLLGHHLTALSLNLEVASHLTEGKAKEQIAKSQSITKLLLSDVRDVVSKLRVDEPLDLGKAIRSLREVVPSPAIELEEDDVSVEDPIIAQTALRAVQEIVTNAVRHSGARHLFLRVHRDNGALAIDARDDGTGTDRVTFGHGLRGMRERVQQSGGSMEVSSMRGRGFEVHVRMPL